MVLYSLLFTLLKMELGTSIKSIRKSKGIKQNELAKWLSISLNSLNAIENNKSFPKKETLQKISEALDKPISYILLNALELDDIPDNKKEVFKAVIEPLKSLL